MLIRQKWYFAAAISLFALQGYAQHSDITFDIEDNQIVIEAEGHTHEGEHGHEEGEEGHEGGLVTADGKWLFEADFQDFAGGPYETDDPGFVTHEAGVMNSGEILGFAGVGALKFWDGLSWTSATDAVVSIEDVFGATTSFTNTGVSAGATTFIDAAGSTGEIHAHIPYLINSDADIGAYLIELTLLGFDAAGENQIYAASESFYLAFNFGLSEADYEQSVDALAAVPVPGAALFMFSALSALGAFGARKRNRK